MVSYCQKDMFTSVYICLHLFTFVYICLHLLGIIGNKSSKFIARRLVTERIFSLVYIIIGHRSNKYKVYLILTNFFIFFQKNTNLFYFLFFGKKN
jgi:hypothetical protein